MHQHCFEYVKKFSEKVPKGSKVLDVGSYDVNGSLRELFTECDYVGCDQVAGPNVDVVQEASLKLPFPNSSFDVVVSANMLEHCEMPWLMVLEMDRVLKPGGKMCITIPWTIHYHPYPVDCYRISHDAMTILFGQWMTSNRRSDYKIIDNRIEDIDTVFIGEKAILW